MADSRVGGDIMSINLELIKELFESNIHPDWWMKIIEEE